MAVGFREPDEAVPGVVQQDFGPAAPAVVTLQAAEDLPLHAAQHAAFSEGNDRAHQPLGGLDLLGGDGLLAFDIEDRSAMAAGKGGGDSGEPLFDHAAAFRAVQGLGELLFDRDRFAIPAGDLAQAFPTDFLWQRGGAEIKSGRAVGPLHPGELATFRREIDPPPRFAGNCGERKLSLGSEHPDVLDVGDLVDRAADRDFFVEGRVFCHADDLCGHRSGFGNVEKSLGFGDPAVSILSEVGIPLAPDAVLPGEPQPSEEAKAGAS